MATGTEYMGAASDDIHQQAEAERQNQAMQIHGRLPIGENIAGYTINDILSFAGGEAELYICEKQGVRYALKYFFEREKDTDIIKKLKNLRHQNIMSHFDFGIFNGFFYSVLQFAEGGALNDKTERNIFKYLPLSEEKAVEALEEILEGFKTIHSKGIIHRDIKPDNIFYSSARQNESGQWIGSNILLGDFGIASLYQADEGMTSHYTENDFATEGYEAPEMYAIGRDAESGDLQKRISPTIDYWALGITLWVLLTGKEPFVDEKGNVLSPGQIRRNATNRQTANILISRSPGLSERMKKLIRGLLVTRHKDRWNYEKIKAHLAGKDVEVFQEAARILPSFMAGKIKCQSFMEITKALLANPEEGKKIVFGKQLKEYMWELVGHEIDDNAQNDAEKIDALIEKYSSKRKEDEGLIAVAYSLTPSLPFILGQYKDEAGNEKNAEVKTMADIRKLLETDPFILIPVLRDETKGFYAYMDVQGYGEAGAKVCEVVGATRSNLKLMPRLQAAFRNNIIAPFQDGVNNGKELKTLDQLDELPDHLKERIALFIEMKKDDVTAWIENLSGKDLDVWLDKYKNQKDKLVSWGTWKYFRLFLDGKDIQLHRTFSSGSGAQQRWGLKNNLGDEILSPVWEFVLASSPPDRFIVKKNGKWGVVKGDGGEILPLAYNLISVFDEDRRLYQCRDSDNLYIIINEDKKILRKGNEPLKIAAAPGQPFNIIYDNDFFYNKDSFKPINKKGSRFTVMETETANYIWVLENKTCTIIALPNEQGLQTPYSGFRSSGKNVPVQKDGKWGVVSVDGSKELVPCIYSDIKKGGNFYALIKTDSSEGILCEFIEDEKKDIYWLKLEKEGGVDILPAGGGEVIASFRSVFNLGNDYAQFPAQADKDFAVNGKISCLSGAELVWFDIPTGKIEKRDAVSKGEIPAILKLLGGMELYVLLSNLKKQNAYNAMNTLIDAASELDLQQTADAGANLSWAADKGASAWPMIIALLDQAHMEGLANTWDVYISWIGGEALRKGKYSDAYSSYAKAIAINPDNAAYHSGCGAAYYHLGDYKNAVEFYDKAASLSEGKLFTAQFLAAKGSAFFNLAKYNEAMAAFTQAISEAGSSSAAEFYNARAACYQKLNLSDKAHSDLKLAEKAPKTSGEKIRGIPLPAPRASSINIEQAAASGNINTILKALDTLKTEGSITAMNNLIDAGWNIFYNNKDYNSALQVLKKINASAKEGLSRPYSYYVHQTGDCLYYLKKYSEAITYYIEASNMETGNVNYLYDCGVTYEYLGDYSKAKEWYRKAAAKGNTKAKERVTTLENQGL